MPDNASTIPLVTLTTDWGQHDFYLGMVKGRLLTVQPSIRIVDLSHDIPSFNLHNAAFVVRHSFKYFPEGSIHLILVNSEASLKHRLLVFQFQGHYFATPDNGILGLLFSSMPEEVYQVPYTPGGGFASLDAFAFAVDLICNNNFTTLLESKVIDFDKKIALRATIDESIINGSIIYIDSYRNAITNISRNLFERVGQNRSFNIFVQSNHNKISKLSTNYSQVDQGELLAIFNSANLLEIAIRDGYAAELLSLRIGGSVRVNFL
jgi:hypothetical protein